MDFFFHSDADYASDSGEGALTWAYWDGLSCVYLVSWSGLITMFLSLTCDVCTDSDSSL